MFRKFPLSMRRKYNAYLSEESIFHIERIFKKIEESEKNMPKLSIIEMPNIQKGAHFNNIDVNMQQTILNDFIKSYKCEFNIDGRTFRIFINTYDSESYDLQNMFENTYKWLFVASKYANIHKCSRILDVYIYLTNLKKLIPRKMGTPIDSTNANTGFTYVCTMPDSNNANEINIFRKEEWFKVFMHETFHSLSLDFSDMATECAKAEEWLKQHLFLVNIPDMRIYETYTEMWAEIMYLAFLSQNKIDAFKEFMCQEMIWSTFQSAKILHHYGLDYIRLLSGHGSHKYSEKTNSLAYYIAKCVFINNIDDFIRWTMAQNKGSIAFRKTALTIDSFVKFLAELGGQESFMEKIQQMDQWWQTHRRELPADMQQTLRMTISG